MDRKEYCKKYLKEWRKNHPYYSRDYMKSHPESRAKQAKYYKKWYKENGRKRKKDYYKVISLWVERNPEKRAASIILNNAIKRGFIIKPNRCSICKEKTNRINGHHKDYNKPLKVLWVCSSCHKKIHSKNFLTNILY